MAWDNLTSIQPVNGINLRDAVSKGLFTVKSGQTIPDNDKCLTKDQGYILLNIEQISGNRLVQKQQLIASNPFVNIPFPLYPFSVCNNDEYIFVSEPSKHRILRFPINGGMGVVIGGTGVAGNSSTQLNTPLGLAIVNRALVCADAGNKRVIKISTSGAPGSNNIETIFSTASQPNPYPCNIGAQMYAPSTGFDSFTVVSLMPTLTSINDIPMNVQFLRHRESDNNLLSMTRVTNNTSSIAEGNYITHRMIQLQFLDFSRPNIVQILAYTTHSFLYNYNAGSFVFTDVSYIEQNQVEQNKIPVLASTYATFSLAGGPNKFITANKLSNQNAFFLYVMPYAINNSGNVNVQVKSADYTGRVMNMSCEQYGSVADSPIFLLISDDGNPDGIKSVKKWQGNQLTQPPYGV